MWQTICMPDFSNPQIALNAAVQLHAAMLEGTRSSYIEERKILLNADAFLRWLDAADTDLS